MTGKSQLCNKELQCPSEFQLQPSKTTTLSEISSWEWTHSHSLQEKKLEQPKVSSCLIFMYKYSKKSQITELAKHTGAKHGHEQCFPNDWPKSQSRFEDEPKNEQRKGSCPQDAPGNYLLKKRHRLGKAYPKQHVQKESVVRRRWDHIMPEV